MRLTKKFALGVGIGALLLAIGAADVMAAMAEMGRQADATGLSQSSSQTQPQSSTSGQDSIRVGDIVFAAGNTLLINARGNTGVQQKVVVNGETAVWNGTNRGHLTDLAVGTWVVVEGTLDNQGLFTAKAAYLLPAEAQNWVRQLGRDRALLGAPPSPSIQ